MSRIVTLEQTLPFAATRSSSVDLAAATGEAPLISCIMATRGAAFPARHAIDCFRRQTYANRELVVVQAEPGDAVRDLVNALADPRIHFIQAPAGATVGTMRNAAITRARGELIAVWDDDDLSHAERLKWQFAGLCAARAEACFLSRVMLWRPGERQLAVAGRRLWENTMLAKRRELPPYPDMPRGGDLVLVDGMRKSVTLAMLEEPLGYCYIGHGGNLWDGAHFAKLIGRAQRLSEGEQYDRDIAVLDRVMPVGNYAAGLEQPG